MAIRETTLIILIAFALETVLSNPLRNQYDEEIETNTIDSNEVIDKGDLNDDPLVTSTTPENLDDLETSTKRNEDIIILRTFVRDGPLIVAKLLMVKVGEQIPIFNGFGSVISYHEDADNEDEAYTDDSVIIDFSELEYTTTELNSY